LNLLKDGKTAEAKTAEQEFMEPAYFSFREQIAKMLKWNQDEAMTVANEMVNTAQHAKRVALLVACFSLLAAFALGWVIIRGVNRALQEMSKILGEASGQVAAAAGQVSGSSQALAEGSSQQAASLEETSSSLEELSSMTKRNAESAGSAKILSGETRAAADAGNGDMTEMRQAMDAIKTSSNDIGKIIKTIDEIAFQTNILALNAAVEAARAGEAGAGFAVVAEEVRALAQRSANSAKETASKIEIAIQNGDHGARISEKVALALGVIVDKARKVDERIAEIANASHEQDQGIGQINTAVSQMDKVTQSNAASAEETASAAEELTAQSAALDGAVGDLQHLVGGVAQPSAVASDQSASPGAHRASAIAAKHPGRHPVSTVRSAASNSPSRDLRSPANARAAAEDFKDM
jgi:methyl-accepting chemotaxis protein